ncbi:MAG: hypothetical protein R6X06_05685 [Gammaproteobacteria bacterium]
MIKDYLSFAEKLVQKLISGYGFHMVKHDKSAMGEWYVYFESAEFILGVDQDRGGFTSIELGSKKRIRPRAHMRGPWSMSHLRGYLEGSKDHYKFPNIESEALWLESNQNQLFDSELLNSDELNKWAAEASRRLFGQASKK